MSSAIPLAVATRGRKSRGVRRSRPGRAASFSNLCRLPMVRRS